MTSRVSTLTVSTNERDRVSAVRSRTKDRREGSVISGRYDCGVWGLIPFSKGMLRLPVWSSTVSSLITRNTELEERAICRNLTIFRSSSESWITSTDTSPSDRIVPFMSMCTAGVKVRKVLDISCRVISEMLKLVTFTVSEKDSVSRPVFMSKSYASRYGREVSLMKDSARSVAGCTG